MRLKPLEQASVLTRALFIIALVMVITAALYPNLKLPTKILGIRLSDELFHILAFATLTFVALQIWLPSSPLVVKLVLFALGLELAQVAAPGREVQLSDVAASLSGIVIGGMVSSASGHIRRAIWPGTRVYQD